jgi:hypothetical protein
MTTAQEKQAEEITLDILAKERLEMCDGDVPSATDGLVNMLLNDAPLLNKVAYSAIRAACKSYVEHNHRLQRQKIIESINTSSAKSAHIGATITALFPEHVDQLMDYPMMRGIKLKDATRSLVFEQAELHRRVARDAAWKANWFTKIGEMLPDEESNVGAVLSAADVLALYNEARK